MGFLGIGQKDENLGDGKQQFWEAGIFDFARGAEGKAAAAQDRADHHQKKADYKAALAGVEAEAPAAAPEARGISAMPTRSGMEPIKDEQGRKQLRKLQQALKAGDAVNEAQSKRLDTLEGDMEHVGETFKKLAKKLQERENTMGFALDRVLGLSAGLIKMLNAGDRVVTPLALQVSEGIKTMQFAGWDNGNKMVAVFADAAAIYAYYDPRVGLASLIQLDRGRSGSGGGGLTSILSGGSGAATGDGDISL